MVKISQREYALKSIDEMRDSKGETFCDINQYLTSPHPALSDYLMNGVHAPLQDKFKEAYNKGLNSFGYAIYSRYLGSNGVIAFSVGRQLVLHSPLMPPSLEWGIHDTIEAHKKVVKPLEFIIFAKAFEGEQDSPLNVFAELATAS